MASSVSHKFKYTRTLLRLKAWHFTRLLECICVARFFRNMMCVCVCVRAMVKFGKAHSHANQTATAACNSIFCFRARFVCVWVSMVFFIRIGLFRFIQFHCCRCPKMSIFYSTFVRHSMYFSCRNNTTWNRSEQKNIHQHKDIYILTASGYTEWRHKPLMDCMAEATMGKVDFLVHMYRVHSQCLNWMSKFCE